MTQLLLLMSAVTLVTTGCAAPQMERELKTVKSHAERDVAVIETVNQKGEEITHVYYQCKLDGQNLACTRACGDKFKCPTNPGLVNASVSTEARGGMKAGKTDGTDTGTAGEADKGGTPGPMDKAKEGVTDDGAAGDKADKTKDKKGDSETETKNKDGDSDANGDKKDGADKEGGQ